MTRHGSIVELSIGLESSLEVVGQDGRGDNLLTLYRLRTSLGIVLAHVGVVGGTEANGRLLALVTNVNTDEHSLLGDLAAEGHAPEVTTKFSVHLTNDVEEDTVVVFCDGAVGNELRDDGTVTVDLVLEEGVEVLMVGVVGHDDKEDEIGVFHCSVGGLDSRHHLLVVVVLDA